MPADAHTTTSGMPNQADLTLRKHQMQLPKGQVEASVPQSTTIAQPVSKIAEAAKGFESQPDTEAESIPPSEIQDLAQAEWNWDQSGTYSNAEEEVVATYYEPDNIDVLGNSTLDASSSSVSDDSMSSIEDFVAPDSEEGCCAICTPALSEQETHDELRAEEQLDLEEDEAETKRAEWDASFYGPTDKPGWSFIEIEHDGDFVVVWVPDGAFEASQVVAEHDICDAWHSHPDNTDNDVPVKRSLTPESEEGSEPSSKKAKLNAEMWSDTIAEVKPELPVQVDQHLKQQSAPPDQVYQHVEADLPIKLEGA